VNATAAIYADYFSSSDSTSQLEVTFHRCDFINNKFNWNGGQPSLIIGNSMQNSLIFQECRFTNNDMIFNNTNVSFICPPITIWSVSNLE
jgi:hypothetical protein